MTNYITLKIGEEKVLTFTTSNNNVAVDLTGCVFTFVLALNNTTVLTVADGDFDKTDILTGIVTITLTEVQTDIDAGVYTGELKIVHLSGIIDKSVDMKITMERALTPTP